MSGSSIRAIKGILTGLKLDGCQEKLVMAFLSLEGSFDVGFSQQSGPLSGHRNT